MRCLVSGELATDKVNTSLITIYKAIEELSSRLDTINSSLEELKETVSNLTEE